MAPRRASPARGTETPEAAAAGGRQHGCSAAGRGRGRTGHAARRWPLWTSADGPVPSRQSKASPADGLLLEMQLWGHKATVLVHCEPGTVWALPACHLLSHYLMALQGPVYPTTDEETEGGETAELKGRGAVCGGTVSCDQACRTGRSALYRAPSWRTGRRWNGVKPGARAGPRRKGVGRPRPGEASGLTPLQRPQEVTVMTPGRA